jgi:hypothetical protein
MDTYDLEIYQGSTYNLSMTLRDEVGNAIDLSSYTTRGVIRNRFSDTGILADLNPQIITPSAGEMTISIAASGTATLPVGIAVYDIEITNTGNGYVTKPLAGKAIIYPESTF